MCSCPACCGPPRRSFLSCQTVLHSRSSRVQGLRHLSMCEAQICQDVRDAQNFAAGISHLTQLSHIDLSRTFMCASGARYVAEALRACSELRVLRLNDLRICQGSSRQFADSVRKTIASLVHLRELHLSQCFVPSCALAAAVASLKGLQVLHMSGAALGDDGAVSLADSLRGVLWLEVLDISDSDMHHRGMAALGPVLREMSSLRELVLTGNRIWPEGASSLAEALHPVTDHASSISGCDSSISGQDTCDPGALGADLGCAVLSGCRDVPPKPADTGPTGLQRLDLSLCGVGPSGLESLAPALLTLTALRELNVHGLPSAGGRVTSVIQRLRAAHRALYVGT